MRLQTLLVLLELLREPLTDLVPGGVGLLLLGEEDPDLWGLFE